MRPGFDNSAADLRMGFLSSLARPGSKPMPSTSFGMPVDFPTANRCWMFTRVLLTHSGF